MNIKLAAEIAHIETTENYDHDRISELAGRFREYGNVNLTAIRNGANAEVMRLELELEAARIRTQVASAILNSRSVIVLD